eukprot:gene1972-12956_t
MAARSAADDGKPLEPNNVVRLQGRARESKGQQGRAMQEKIIAGLNKHEEIVVLSRNATINVAVPCLDTLRRNGAIVFNNIASSIQNRENGEEKVIRLCVSVKKGAEFDTIEEK